MKYKQSYKSGLTREKIDAYSKASNPTRREIEGSLTGPFEQDALDGWETSGLQTGQMKRLDKRFQFQSSTPYIVGGALITICSIIFFFTFNTIETPKQVITEKIQLSTEQSDAIMPVSIDTMQELPKSRQIQITALKTTQQGIKSQPENTPMTQVDELPIVIFEPLKLEIESPTQKISTQKTAKEIYLHDLKLIDYSQYRSKPAIETERIILSGTPADLENKLHSETETTVTTVSIPYMDYIDKTMSYVGKGKWKQSLQRLQLILATYPDDVNGHFYAGLCSYNLQQYEDAKQHFATCLQLSFNNFNEEATWYLAQSLVANGEKNNAKQLLTTIRDQKGYYAKQAEQLLKGLK